jgi:hypothetical protein
MQLDLELVLEAPAKLEVERVRHGHNDRLAVELRHLVSRFQRRPVLATRTVALDSRSESHGGRHHDVACRVGGHRHLSPGLLVADVGDHGFDRERCTSAGRTECLGMGFRGHEEHEHDRKRSNHDNHGRSEFGPVMAHFVLLVAAC